MRHVRQQLGVHNGIASCLLILAWACIAHGQHPNQVSISNDTTCSDLTGDYLPAGLVDCRVTGHLSTQSLLSFTFRPTNAKGAFNLLIILRALRGKAYMNMYYPADKLPSPG
jgi:hypothetical protein